MPANIWKDVLLYIAAYYIIYFSLRWVSTTYFHTLLSYGFGDEEDGAWSYNRGEFENVVNYFKDNISLLSRVSPSLASS